MCLKVFYSCKILKMREKKLWNPQTFFVFVLYCTKRRSSQIKPQLKVEIGDGREALLYKSKSTLIRNLNKLKHPHSSDEFPDQHLRQISPGLSELWSEIQITKVIMQGKLIAVAYTLGTYWNQFSLCGIFKQE